MSTEQVRLDPEAVARRIHGRYQRIVGDLTEEVAQLATYAAAIEAELDTVRGQLAQQKQTDAWGDPATTTTGGE